MLHLATIRISRFIAALVLVSVVLAATRRSALADPPKVGIEKRVAWTTSRITGSPELPLPYVTERVFPALKFNQCLDITTAPGSDRLFVVEQSGKIFSFPNEPDVAAADSVVDLAKDIAGVQAVYALAFHPDFQTNRYCYVCYIKAANLEDGTHIARFRVTDTDPPTIDPASETTIITWLSGGHNGCCLKFGLDGCLYISTGDGSGPNPPDSLRGGQDISNLLSCILRIDVDHADDGKHYRIPADNPFVGLDGARGEIWAYGFRNPWRMSIDRKTGDLWVGDVGWELWEMLDRVERGGNYGWSVMEGRQSTNPEWARGPTPILPPTIDVPHSESSSITDGLTYYGSRLKELHGTHIYSDYDTGKFWGFRYENGEVVDHRELADTTHRVVGFGEDHDGEFYVLDHAAGTIHRLVPNSQPDLSATFPRKLSETGLFASVADQAPAPGVVPYSINAEPWSDHAVAERLIAVPNELSIKSAGAKWEFPKDSVFAKTLSLDIQHGNPTIRRKIETQILHFDGIDWQPYTYQWNDEQSDAVLLDAAGAERTFDIVDANAPDGRRRQTWRFSGRAECQRCHNPWSGFALGFITPQLNKEHDYAGGSASQIDTLAHIKIFETPIPNEERPRLANPRDPSADQDGRARAYLQTNCAHCHRMHAGGSVLSHMHYDLPLDKTNMVGARPSQGTFGIHAAQVIAPGDPFRSVLLYRMAKLGGGRMPHIGSSEVDRDGVELIYEWIRQMPHDAGDEVVGNEAAAKLRGEEAADLERLQASESATDQAEIVDRLLLSTSGALLLLRSVDHHELPVPAVSVVVQRAARHNVVSIRDLFERFLPADERIKRLGSVVQPEQILSLPNDPVRGKQVFFETAGVSCKNCHRIHKEGKEVGPELTAIGKKLTPAQLLESILEPSKLIDPKYVTYLAEIDDGRLLTGLLVHRDDNEVVLKDAEDKLIRISTSKIEQLVPQRQSLMPELLLRDMTAQQVADLLSYLSSLK
ncbi:MAG: PQQ-dependent sugar dehydrogenase [Planctomycetota bacterium]|nr:PQQ-dependent sugar dehydrogenase [Planctomycetota bacterium]